MSSVLGRLLLRPPYAFAAPLPSRLGIPDTVRGPRIPEGVDWADVLFLWDPQASYTRDWAGSQELAAGGSGSATDTIKLGSAVVTFDADTYLSGTPFGDSLSAIGSHTVYAVGAAGTAVLYAMHLTAPVANGTSVAGSIQTYFRLTGGRSAATIWDETTAAQSTADNLLAADTVARLVAEYTTSTVNCWRDGLQNSGEVAHALDPGSATAFDQVDIGGTHNTAGDGDGDLFYICVVSGTRSATAEAWLAGEFPVGEVV